jgi:hypothetical protein
MQLLQSHHWKERINCLTPQQQPHTQYLRDLRTFSGLPLPLLVTYMTCLLGRSHKIPPRHTGWLFHLSRILFRILLRLKTYKFTSLFYQVVKSRLFLDVPSVVTLHRAGRSTTWFLPAMWVAAGPSVYGAAIVLVQGNQPRLVQRLTRATQLHIKPCFSECFEALLIISPF